MKQIIIISTKVLSVANTPEFLYVAIGSG